MKTAFLVLLVITVASPMGVLSDEKVKSSAMADMELVKGGAFKMGDIFEEGVRLATPVHEVTVSDFYLCRYEVSIVEFKAFSNDTKYVTSAEKGEGPPKDKKDAPSDKRTQEYNTRLASSGAYMLLSSGPPSWSNKANWKNPGFEQGPQDPVTCVSWNDAIAYCNWLSKKESLPAAYDQKTGNLLDKDGKATTDITKVKGYRLPTESEWEYAAREGGKKIRFGNGKDKALSSEINFNAAGRQFSYSEKGECRDKTVPVNSFKPNCLGLHNMSGNVWEWCSDFLCNYKSGSLTNPYRTEDLVFQSRRAARSGPWFATADYQIVVARIGWIAEDRCNNIGFRIARSK